MYTPTLHKPIPMETRVRIPAGYITMAPLYGRVVGISSIHIVFGYIVLLDHPLDTEYGPQCAVVVNGPQLESEDGLTNWRLDEGVQYVPCV